MPDPLTVFGEMSIPLLISNLATLIGFLLATYFAADYTEKFYGKRPKPRSWVFIIAGLVSVSIAEVGEFLSPYLFSSLDFIVLLIQSTILSAQGIGVILIAAGCLLLSKEIV